MSNLPEKTLKKASTDSVEAFLHFRFISLARAGGWQSL
jgi:hypothetical protein